MRTRWHMNCAGPAPANALAYEMPGSGLLIVQQCGVRVHYKGVVVGEYFVDLLVEDILLVDLRTVKALDNARRMQ